MLGRMMHLGYEDWIRKNVTSDFKHEAILAAKEFCAQLNSGEVSPEVYTPRRDWNNVVLPPGWVKAENKANEKGLKFEHTKTGLKLCEDYEQLNPSVGTALVDRIHI